ncbi:MAG: SRPBCC family protein [Marinagarivorans sp.]
MSGTVSLYRVFKAPAERVYRAFLDADALTKWLPPQGFTCQVEHLNAQVGGSFRMAFTQFANGERHGFSGEYLELVPFSRIRYSDRFDDPNLPGELIVSIELTEEIAGTAVTISQTNIPAAIPVSACYLGWQESLNQLAQLVEACTG